MKITKVRLRKVDGRIDAELNDFSLLHGQRHRLPKDIPNGYGAPFQPLIPAKINPDGTEDLTALFLYIETDEGITGVSGPLFKTEKYDIAPFKGILIGADPFNTEYIWDMMYRSTIKVGYRELRAMSAIDVALWDIKSKACGQPLHRMIGGKIQKELPAYASSVGIGYHDGVIDYDEVTDYTKAIVADGYKGSKWWITRGPNDGDPGVREMAKLVRTIRDAAGPDHKIMIDAWCGYTYEYTMRVCEAIKEYDIFFFEEPIIPNQMDTVARLSQNCPVPIAIGEHLLTRYDWLRQINAGFRGFAQPDPYWCGGVTEYLKIMDLLTTYDFPVTLHNTRPSLGIQLEAPFGINVIPITEHHAKLHFSSDWFLKYPADTVNGMFKVSDVPGCHLDVNEEHVERETWIEV